MELRKLFFRTSLLFVVVCAGCASYKAKQTPVDPLALIFNRATSIKLLSYANDAYDAIQVEGQEEKSTAPIDTVVRVVADLRIPESIIKEEIELNKRQRNALYTLLQTNMCEIDEGAICYYPRHAILFYDLDDQPFSYVEICFECTNYRTSDNLPLDFCYEKSQAIKDFFQLVGIKYFEVGER
jgi:hypothetical protein